MRVLRACKGTFQCCMHVCVRACVRVSVACLHACVCLLCVRVSVACVRVLRACMCTCEVRLHVSRLTSASLVIRFSSRWIRNKGPAVYHQTPPPEPPATTSRTAGPRHPRPARATTPPRLPQNQSRRCTGHPSSPPRAELFLRRFLRHCPITARPHRLLPTRGLMTSNPADH